MNFSRLESFHKRLLVMFHLILLDFLLWVYGLIRTNSKVNWYIIQELIMDHCEGKHFRIFKSHSLIYLVVYRR